MKEKIIEELFDRIERLYPGLISDVLDDKLGFKENIYIMEYKFDLNNFELYTYG